MEKALACILWPSIFREQAAGWPSCPIRALICAARSILLIDRGW